MLFSWAGTIVTKFSGFNSTYSPFPRGGARVTFFFFLSGLEHSYLIDGQDCCGVQARKFVPASDDGGGKFV